MEEGSRSPPTSLEEANVVISQETNCTTFTTYEQPARLRKQNFAKFRRFHACRRHPLFGRYSNCAVSKIRADILGSSSFGSSPYPVSLAIHLRTPRSWKAVGMRRLRRYDERQTYSIVEYPSDVLHRYFFLPLDPFSIQVLLLGAPIPDLLPRITTQQDLPSHSPRAQGPGKVTFAEVRRVRQSR
jgi:hypothetical protein